LMFTLNNLYFLCIFIYMYYIILHLLLLDRSYLLVSVSAT
jgi:hypothetical protein